MIKNKGAFYEYWQEKKAALSLVTSDVFLHSALRYGYFPETGVLPDFFETDFETSSYKEVRAKRKRIKDSAKYNTIYNIKSFDLVRFTHTNGSGYRVYSLVHPYQYWLLCKELADNLPRIIKILTKYRDIVSYSIPDLMNLEQRREDGIASWLRMAEGDLVSESGAYSHLLKADITAFYDSIYTHAISWAIHGKPVAKKKRGNFSLLGNRLDKLAQCSNDSQTNGLPIGPVTSDILSELVLSSLDETVSKKLNTLKIDYRAARYKDDYRFLTHSHGDAMKIKKILTEVLQEYGMNINQGKTTIDDDIVATYTRDWKHTLYGFGLDSIEPSSLKQVSAILDKIYRHQKETVGKQPALSLMEELYQYVAERGIDNVFEDKTVKEIIAKLVHMHRLLPATLPYSIQLLDLILEKYNIAEKEKFIILFANYFGNVTDDDLIAWLYRLHLKISINAADTFLLNTRGDSRMKHLLQRRWIFDDNNYNANGFSRQSISFISNDSVLTAGSRRIEVGFRYSSGISMAEFEALNEDIGLSSLLK